MLENLNLFCEHGNCYKVWSSRVRVTNSQFVSWPIIAHLNANAWLRHGSTILRG